MIQAIFGRIWGYVIAAGSFLAVLLGIYLKGRSDANTTARMERMKREAKANEDRLEMHREATEIERKVAGMTDEEARREADKWAGH